MTMILKFERPAMTHWPMAMKGMMTRSARKPSTVDRFFLKAHFFGAVIYLHAGRDDHRSEEKEDDDAERAERYPEQRFYDRIEDGGEGDAVSEIDQHGGEAARCFGHGNNVVSRVIARDDILYLVCDELEVLFRRRTDERHDEQHKERREEDVYCGVEDRERVVERTVERYLEGERNDHLGNKEREDAEERQFFELLGGPFRPLVVKPHEFRIEILREQRVFEDEIAGELERSFFPLTEL